MFKFENIKQILPKIVIFCMLIAIYSGMLVYAKYVSTITVDNGKVTITANLGDITVDEHMVAKNDDGSYELTSTLISAANKSGNEYFLIPGLDIPKDPFVKITNKSDIPVYVFVEVVANFTPSDKGIYFSLAENWKKIEDVTGPNGGTVYYYNTSISENIDLPILAPLAEGSVDTIQVSQYLKENTNGSLKLDFYAYMGQTAAGDNAQEVYGALFAPNDN